MLLDDAKDYDTAQLIYEFVRDIRKITGNGELNLSYSTTGLTLHVKWVSDYRVFGYSKVLSDTEMQSTDFKKLTGCVLMELGKCVDAKNI